MRRMAPHIFRQRFLIEGFYSRPLGAKAVYALLEGLVAHLGLEKYAEPIVHSPRGRGREANQGYDAFVPLVDSGICTYIWEADRFFSILIYSCKPFSEDEAIAYSTRFLRVTDGVSHTTF